MRTLKLLVWGIIILYLQIFLAAKIAIASIIPNLFVAYVAFLSVNLRHENAVTITFFLCLAYDLTYPILLGLNTISCLILSVIVSTLQKNINKDRFSGIALSMFLLNLIYYSFFLFYYLFLNQLNLTQVTNFILSVLYNTFISVIFIYILVILDRIKLRLDV
ncbi:MAG: rod shape-determining protein MreD [Candidatus Cloacimonetes bacterium]|nr:rod shape-determining protein MreD [Candidatus Cloacimonadota bacterium]